MIRKPGRQDFKVDLKKFSEAIDVEFEKVVRRVVLEIFEGVTRRTPVDTGRARASWFTNAGPSAGNDVAPDPGDGGSANFASANASAAADVTANVKKDPFQKQWVYNNLPYIESLENGSSDQAPSGMVAVTVAEVEGRMQKIIDSIEGKS